MSNYFDSLTSEERDEIRSTKSFHFGAKVKFLKQDKIHPDLRDKEFCLIGFDDNAFAVIEWDKRGGYGFEYYTGSVYSDLELIA